MSTISPGKLCRHERRLSKAGYRMIAGVDEAGRGPLAGPVVAGAVILCGTDFDSEIDDSKKISASKRELAYNEIIGKCVYGVGIVDEKWIDRINIYQATLKAMMIAIEDLEARPDYILVDGPIKLPCRCPVRSIIRGDSKSLSIAAASIIAKVTRDRIMRKYDSIYPDYGFKRHKGYPTVFHKQALKSHGPSPIHRRSFKPVRDLLQ